METISLITGVSRATGLGYETAKQLSAMGHTVIITARDAEKAKLLATEAGILSMSLDITDEKSVDQVAFDMEKQFGRLDVLINNAGGFYDQGGKALSADIPFIKEALDTNLLGAWRMAKAFVPLLKKSLAGRMVNVSSGAGSFSDSFFGLVKSQVNAPVYSITKLALNGLTVKLARELKHTPIKVNSVCPGFVATRPGTEKWGARPVSEGAKGIVWAATLPDDGPSGGFFRDGQPLNW